MAIEKAIEDLTAAIKENTAVLTSLIIAQQKAPGAQSSGDNSEVVKEPPKQEVKQEKVKPSETKPVKEESAKPVSQGKKETKPETASEPEPEPEPEPKLDADFYAANVRPVLISLAKKDIMKLKELLAEFGVDKGDQIPPESWGDAIKRAKALMSV